MAGDRKYGPRSTWPSSSLTRLLLHPLVLVDAVNVAPLTPNRVSPDLFADTDLVAVLM